MSERLNILNTPHKANKEPQSLPSDPKPWYSSGLRFKCTECGQCCTGAPGYVWVSEEEAATMAQHLKLTPSQFRQKYIRRVGDRDSLLEDSRTFDCIFLKDKKCQIYQVRPKQCRTFPWWQHNLHSEKQWNEAGKYCEGINHPDAPLIPENTIAEQLAK